MGEKRVSFENGLKPEIEAKNPEFEDILDQVGHFGCYQICLFLLLSATDFGAGMSMLYFIFANYLPEWRCVQYEGNFTFSDLGGNLTSEWSLDMDNCQIVDRKCVEFEFRGDVSIVSEVGYFIYYLE